MKKPGKRSVGRSRHGVLTALALVAVAAFAFGPKADATTSQAQKLDAVLRSPAGEYRKQMAVDELLKLNSNEAKTKLLNLADAPEQRLELLAIRALGRRNAAWARNKVKAVYEDAGRTDLVRATALIAFLCSQKGQNKNWSDVKGYVKQHAGSNQLLRDQYKASKAKFWPAETE